MESEKRRAAQELPNASHPTIPFPKHRLPIDAEPSRQVLKFRLKSGFVGIVILPTSEIHRLWYRVQKPDSVNNFIVFDNDKRRFALNIRHLVAIQFDWIGDDGLQGKDIEENEDISDFYFSDSQEPLHLEVDPDELTLQECDESKMDGNGLCQVADFFCYFDMTRDGFDDAKLLRISDGSIIWFRMQQLSFVSMPRWHFADQRTKKAGR